MIDLQYILTIQNNNDMKKNKIIIAACATMFGLTALCGTASAQETALPQPTQSNVAGSLTKALQDRRSTRTFSDTTLSDQTLADLLWAADGVNRKDGKRTAPSAMNRQDVTIYVGKADGTFRYDAAANKLVKIGSGDLRKAANPVITGYEFHVLQLVSQVCPHKRILPYLKQTLTELKRRKPDAQPWFRVRLVVTGSEIDDPAFTKLIEDCGAMVVADRYCYGSLPGREQIEILDGETPLRAVARHYLRTSQCPRFMERARSDGRRTYIRDLCREYSADGVLYEQMKFCEFWSYERVLGVHILQEELGIPTVGIEKEYTLAGAGQLRTRIQAFVESLEIKHIQGGKL